MTDAELKALAEKATPGPWASVLAMDRPEDGYTVKPFDMTDGEYGYGALDGPDADYIAACSPDRILALLSRLSRAQARVARLEQSIRLAISDMRVADECGGGLGQTVVQLRAVLAPDVVESDA